MRPARNRVRRRRLLALAAVAVSAGAIGAAIGSGGDSEREGDPPAAARPSADRPLPLEQAVGQLLVMAFEGTAAPPYVRRRLRDGEGAGVILFGGNVVDADQVRRLTRAIQRSAGGGALIATDQEGGEIRNLPFAGPVAPQSALASPAAAR
ncbi:MAG TPA: hypothetical protein VHH14_08650, partial [Solirubrobacterales bacterium]|nr:hypothetical protein [Solirubrobacterales bacterium]